jgi:hypothetical protein
MRRALRFHRAPASDSNLPDTAEFMRTCLDAEAAGIGSVQLPVGLSLSEALALAADVGSRTARLSFRMQCGPDLPFGQNMQDALQDAWNVLGPRLIVHMQLQSGNFHSASEFMVDIRRLFAASLRRRGSVGRVRLRGYSPCRLLVAASSSAESGLRRRAAGAAFR